MATVIDSIVSESYDTKTQLGDLPETTQGLKRFTNSFKPKRHSVKINKGEYNTTNNILIFDSSTLGIWGQDNWGEQGDAFDSILFAVVPENNIFEEYFHEGQYISSSSTGTLNSDDSYTLQSGEVLESEIIAKIRQPINKVLIYSNDSFIDEEGMDLPFTLGESTFGGNNVEIQVSNDSGLTWYGTNENTNFVFPSTSTDDELKYRITANAEVTISNSIRIKVN